MRKVEFIWNKNLVDVFLSEKMYSERLKINSELMSDVYNSSDSLDTLIDSEKMKFINLYSKISNNNRIAILDAHGNSENGLWTYKDYENKPSKNVEKWIRKNDKHYNLIVLLICNPGGHNINSKNSILIYPARDVVTTGLGGFSSGRLNSSDGENSFQFRVPKIGFLDGYIIEYETKELMKRLSKN